MTIVLAWIFEVWKWSDGETTFFGVVLLLFGAYGLGFTVGRYPDDRGDIGAYPRWVQIAIVALIVGVVLVLAANSTDCAPGECERPGP